jgi:hypothetical protein
MPDIDFTFSLLSISLIIVIAGIVGYTLGSLQLRRNQMKVVKLRREMANNHAYILELQKECVDLENQLHKTKATVLPLTSIVKDFMEENKNKAEGHVTPESVINKRKDNLSLSWKQRI